MTTSEFILGHSADDAEDRRQEAHKIVWALLAALALHLVIGVSIALSSGWLSSPITIEEDKPVELTFVDLNTPAPTTPKNPMFMETDESKASVEKPKDQTFESNANSIGASEIPATGEAALPSQQGKDRPVVDLETHNYSLPNDGAQPQPKSIVQETPAPSVAPTPKTAPSEADQFALLTSTPPPKVQPSVATKPQPPKSSYQQLRQQTRIQGNISNRGISAVNAVGTPLGRYQKRMFDAIGSRWYASVGNRLDLFGVGTASITFRVDRTGQIKNIQVNEKACNELFVDFCIQCIQEAHLEPMSDDLAATLPPEGLDVELPFIIFPN